MAYRNFNQPDVPDRPLIDTSIVSRIHSEPFRFHEGNTVDHEAAVRKKYEKKPSFKIDETKAPFAEDQRLIGEITNRGLSKSMNGQDPAAENSEANQVSGMSIAHNNSLKDTQARVNELQQQFGGGVINPTALAPLYDKAYNKDNVNTRGETLGKISEQVSDPSISMYNHGKYIQNIYDKLPEQTATYGDDTGLTGSTVNVKGKILVPSKDPIMVYHNGKLIPQVIDGAPQYKMKPAQTEEEFMKTAKSILDGNEQAKEWSARQAYRANQKEIDSQVRQWADTWQDKNGFPPSQEAIEMTKKNASIDLATRKTASVLKEMEDGLVSVTNKRQLPPQQSEASKANDYSLQQSSTTSQKNLVRQRTFNKTDGTKSAKVDTYSYHTPMKSVVPLNKNGKPLKGSFGNVSGTNETTGAAFVSAQTVEDAPINGLNLALGTKKYVNGKGILRDVSISADQNEDWATGALKALTTESIKSKLKKGEDVEIYPWAEVSVPKRKDDLSNLSSKDREDAERIIELSKIPPSEMDEDQRKEFAEKSVKYKEYIDHNVSMNANEIPQLHQLAKRQGYKNIKDWIKSQMSPVERNKLEGVEKELEQRKAVARKEIDAEKSGAKNKMITVTIDGKQGQIPESNWAAMKAKYPNATR